MAYECPHCHSIYVTSWFFRMHLKMHEKAAVTPPAQQPPVEQLPPSVEFTLLVRRAAVREQEVP